MSTTEGNLTQEPTQTVEEQVAAIMGVEPQAPADGKPAPKADPSTAPAATAPSPELPGQPPSTDTPTEEAPTLEAQLAAIEAEEGKAPEPGKLTSEQEQILKVIPSVEAGRELWGAAQSYNQLANAFSGGDFETFEKAVTKLSPDAANAYEEHLYQKFLAGPKPVWIERWLAERDPANAPVHQAMSGMEKKLAALERQLAESGKAKQNEEVQAQQQRVAKQYLSHLDGLFDRINTPKEDRQWVANAIHNKVMADPEVGKKLREGQFTAVNKIFATTVNDYNKRSQAAGAAKDGKLDAQAGKKAPLPSSAPVQTELSDDINKVPADKREGWVQNKLNALFSSTK